VDALTLARIELLHPKLRDEARKIYAEICMALTGRAMCRFAFTLRTWKEQKALYELGRSVRNPDGVSVNRPLGNIVTNAAPGQSYHNYGLAVDIALVIDGKTAVWDRITDFDGDKKADWMECVAVFKKYGWEWGGDWSSLKDYPHFQKTFGYKWPQLQAMYNKKQFIEKTVYIKF
jgi:peptidoglycan LD-endopeptidase CwlK